MRIPARSLVLLYRPFVGVLLLFLAVAPDLSARNVRLRAVWNDDPATTMTIGFQQVSGRDARLYYDVIDQQTNIGGYRFVERPQRTEFAHGMQTHFVRLKGLQPNTVYYFVLVDSEGTSKRYSFQTSPVGPDARLSVVAGGDSRNNRAARCDANAAVSKLRPTVVLFGGDMTVQDEPTEWEEWLDDWQLTISGDGRIYPLIVARGNHERTNQTVYNLFDTAGPEIYYAMTLGGNLLRIYTLNTLIPAGGSQARWLEQDLSRNTDVIWKIAQYHHTMRPHTTGKPERDDLMDAWADLFYQYGVNVAVESDVHVVKTTWPIRPSREPGSELGFIRDDAAGTVFVGEGCWGAPLRDNNDDKSWTRNSGRFNQFKWMFIDAGRLELRTVMTDGASRLAEVSPANIFVAPPGLQLWEPSNGSVVTLYNRQATGSRPIAASPGRSDHRLRHPPRSGHRAARHAARLRTVSRFHRASRPARCAPTRPRLRPRFPPARRPGRIAHDPRR